MCGNKIKSQRKNIKKRRMAKPKRGSASAGKKDHEEAAASAAASTSSITTRQRTDTKKRAPKKGEEKNSRRGTKNYSFIDLRFAFACQVAPLAKCKTCQPVALALAEETYPGGQSLFLFLFSP